MAGYDFAKIQQLVKDLEHACDQEAKDGQTEACNSVLFKPAYRELWLFEENRDSDRLGYWATFADGCYHEDMTSVLELSEEMYGKDFRREIIKEMIKRMRRPESLSEYDRRLMSE